MSFHPTILNQILNLVDRLKFQANVNLLNSDKNVKSITSWSLFVLNIFAQISNVKSMRHLQFLYNRFPKQHYHLGCSNVSLNGISYAMSVRPSSVFREYFYQLLSQVDRQKTQIGRKFKKYVSIVDSTSIPFSGDGSDWAQAGKSRREARSHVLIDGNGKPLDMVVTGASVHDIKGFDMLNLGKTEVIVMDRAYYGYKLWKHLGDKGVLFVTRSKSNMKYVVVSIRKGRRPNRIVSDENIFFYKNNLKKKEKLELRRIVIATKKGYISLITNDLYSNAKTIAALYKSRWEIEKFFKWIKQNLKIKRFLGRSKNAIEIQLWVAMIVYLLLYMIKIQFKFNGGNIELIRLINAKLMLRISLYNLLNPDILDTYMNHIQLSLFNSSGH